MFLLAMLGTSQPLVFVLLISTVLFSAPALPTFVGIDLDMFPNGAVSLNYIL
jgi:hypothetical protein